MASLLDQLRTLSAVDCDTLDVEVAAKLGPFNDCTSNQAIAFAELSRLDSDGKPLHRKLIAESLLIAHWQVGVGKQTDATLEELAVELMMVGLSLRIVPHTTGYLHVQTNPKLAYSIQKTIKNAERIIYHFKQLAPIDTKRICIKIPSTWEGLQACRELEKKGINTLATTLFSLEQTALAAAVGCRYIAPYVNELRVHFDPSYTDTNPSLALCGAAQHYLDARPVVPKTQVLAASLTSVEQVMQLAGIHHITVSPPLLAELAATPAAGWAGAAVIGREAVVSNASTPINSDLGSADSELESKLGAESGSRLEGAVLEDEGLWRMAFTRAGGGGSEVKLVQAINIFADMQDRLEDMARAAERVVRAGEA
ncbi:hypothetical protein C8A00DRAFT_37464 [Chaetomidium leptoderma]|uniref:Transaldolase n=1 Tax=Chaetomidium leptoderma TaxID=669021 RepID=A0AAN6ZTQ9_9PEZI|nr:hypothetical protein C8A00DRAFT_37464 [Chaetomidium leptoderma]